MKKSVGLACAAGLAALALVACGGGGSQGGSGGTPPPVGGGGGGTPTPPPAQTPAPPPAFSFAASFAFETTLGVESTMFTWQDGTSGTQRLEAVTPRFLSGTSPARLSFEVAPPNEVARIRFDGVDRTFTSNIGAAAGFRRFFGSSIEEELRIGPFSPFFTRGSDTSAEVAIALFQSAPTGFTSGTRVGTARRLIFAVIGNPSLETGRIPVSRRFVTEGGFTSLGDFTMLSSTSLVTISSDYNTGIFGGFSVARTAPNGGNLERLADLNFKGAHDPATNRLTGTIRDQADRVVGNFEGGLYGPRRQRIAFVYEFAIPETGNLKHIGFLYGLEG